MKGDIVRSLNPLKRVNSILTWYHTNEANFVYVSIPSSGSIQFLLGWKIAKRSDGTESQSPQAGQFNSYHPFGAKQLLQLTVSIPSSGSIQFLRIRTTKKPIEVYSNSLNPLKRVNSILTWKLKWYRRVGKSLNPLKRVNSILTLLLRLYKRVCRICLNPLKRVNSILTMNTSYVQEKNLFVSQSPQAGQFNSYSGVFK